jgi:hypothetical protein
MENSFNGMSPEEIQRAYDISLKKRNARHDKMKEQAEAMQPTTAAVLIGIDPGTHTGFAVKMYGAWQVIETKTIYKAINDVIWLAKNRERSILVRFEDARLRTYFGKSDREKLQGAGSVKRDCAIWEEVLTEYNIPFQRIHPRYVKATTAEQFKTLTGWHGQTSIHAREAAWLIL